MLETISISGFFLIGLMGGLGHCIGMCGPLVLWVSTRYVPEGASVWRAAVPHLYYKRGPRTVTYTALGALAGLAGSVADLGGKLVGIQRVAAIGAGLALMTFALLSLVGSRALAAIEEKASTGGLAMKLLKRGPGHPLATGIALGFLPCGLSYGAVIGAAALGSWWKGALSLAAFGLGTIPALLALSFIGNFLASRRDLLNRIAMLLMLGMGGYFVYYGVTM